MKRGIGQVLTARSRIAVVNRMQSLRLEFFVVVWISLVVILVVGLGIYEALARKTRVRSKRCGGLIYRRAKRTQATPHTAEVLTR